MSKTRIIGKSHPIGMSVLPIADPIINRANHYCPIKVS